MYTNEVWFMVLNATFNNISVISWRSVLLVEETVYPEKTTDLSQVTDILSHNVVSSTPRHEQDFELTTLVVMGTDCTGSCKSNYHMIMATTAPYTNEWWLDIQYGLREGEKDLIINHLKINLYTSTTCTSSSVLTNFI